MKPPKKKPHVHLAGGLSTVQVGYLPARAMSLADISVIAAVMATAGTVMDATISETASTQSSSATSKLEIIINYQRAYWEVGMDLYRKCRESVPRPDIMDAAITNLYIGLIKLFGMHWTPEDKHRYNQQRDMLHTERFAGASINKEDEARFASEYPQTDKDYTFPLYTMIKVGYVLAKDWNLADVDDGIVLANFKRLNNYFTNISRHFEAKKIDTAVQTAMAELDLYVDTVRRIVRWFMQKFYGNVPGEAKTQFEQVFATAF